MVSEVAHKSFDNKNEKNDELIKANNNDDFHNLSSERIEPSFLDNGEEQIIKSSSYEDSYDSGIASDNDSMNIPSFLRRNRD
tara:strand:- start:1198 stop:1443 length:246 start_codon:yes stop_codon:yes gene_type:complete